MLGAPDLEGPTRSCRVGPLSFRAGRTCALWGAILGLVEPVALRSGPATTFPLAMQSWGSLGSLRGWNRDASPPAAPGALMAPPRAGDIRADHYFFGVATLPPILVHSSAVATMTTSFLPFLVTSQLTLPAAWAMPALPRKPVVTAVQEQCTS